MFTVDRKIDIEAGAIGFTALLFILRPSCPFFKYPFALSYLLLTVYFFFRHKRAAAGELYRFVRYFALPLTLLLALLIAFILSDKMYLAVLKELLSILILLSLFFMLSVIIPGRKELRAFSHRLENMFIYFSVFISALGLIELFDLFGEHDFLTEYQIFSKSLRQRLMFDYNYAVLPLFFGMLGVLNKVNVQNSLLRNVLLNILFFTFSLSVLFSGSVRGIIILTLFFIILVGLKIYAVIKNRITTEKFIYKFNSVIFSFIIIVFVIWLFIFHTTGSFKTNFLEFIGSRNVSTVKHDITAYLHKYVYLADKDITFKKLNDFLWTPHFDPKDPDSGWGTRIHSDMYPLPGHNSTIVPEGSIGYRMDNTADPDTSDGVNSRIWTAIPSVNIKDPDSSGRFTASVYCFVSDDFDGSYARIYDNDSLFYYDLNKKGTWQLLKIEFSGYNPDVAFEWAKLGSCYIKDLKGYVVFAYPSYEKHLIPAESLGPVPEYTRNYAYAGFWNPGYIFSGISKFNVRMADPLLNRIADWFSEDTAYREPKTHLVMESTPESVINNRPIRWKFAIQIFSKEYDFKQKLFGGGFTFLNWYGFYFIKDKNASEYPHNPFLHVLLYSGIIGLALYLLMLYRVFDIYIRFIGTYPLFFGFFLITFFFTFFSGGNPFDPPVMGFFILLPFFIHYIINRHSLQENSVENG